MLDEVQKYVELIEKMPEPKTMMLSRSSWSDNCVRVYSIKILNLLNPQLQLINTKSIIKNKVKNLFGELKKFKLRKILVSQKLKIDDHKPTLKIIL